MDQISTFLVSLQRSWIHSEEYVQGGRIRINARNMGRQYRVFFITSLRKWVAIQNAYLFSFFALQNRIGKLFGEIEHLLLLVLLEDVSNQVVITLAYSLLPEVHEGVPVKETSWVSILLPHGALASFVLRSLSVKHLFHETKRWTQLEEICGVNLFQRSQFAVISERIVAFFASTRQFYLPHWEIVWKCILEASPLLW